MFGMSRGGFYAYRWAVRYPERVACVYADAPVLDILQLAAGRGKGRQRRGLKHSKTTSGIRPRKKPAGSKATRWTWCLEIVKGGYPMLHICGDADEAVPIEENTGLFERKVLAAGEEKIQVIRKPGGKIIILTA